MLPQCYKLSILLIVLTQCQLKINSFSLLAAGPPSCGFLVTSCVAIVCEYPTLLGGERSLLAALPYVLDAQIQVRAITPPGKLALAFEGLGVPVTTWAARRKPRESSDDHRVDRELADILTRLRPDLVHANSLTMGRLVGRVASSLGIKSIAHLRDIVRLSRAAIDDLNRNSRLLAVSDAVKQYHCDAGLDLEKVHVVYNGVDLERFAPRPATGRLHRELDLSPNVRLVGAIGQVSLRKGWDVLVDAAKRLIAQRSDVAFVLVGACYSNKPETRDVERRLVDACRESPGRICWLGERDDVADILPELSILAHAARQEPLGRVLLEAAAAGCAIVATDVGGTTEVFPPHHAAARLIPANDAAALANVVSDLLDNETERQRLGERARSRAVEAFDAQNSAADLLRHYQEVAALAK
jgi:glycosyltransferase involved in cell wall biosynthesis